MQQLSSDELNRRIDTFLTKKHEEFPELKLRRKESKHKKSYSVSEVFTELVAGFKWEFGR